MQANNRLLLHYLIVILFIFGIYKNCSGKDVLISLEPDKTEAPRFVREIEGVQELLLSNGLQILLIPDHGAANVSINLVYRTGAKQEAYGEKGIAHLLEHVLVMRGSPKHPNLAEEMKKKGLRRIGTTGHDYTSYRSIIPANDDLLNWVLEVEAERMLTFKYHEADLKIALHEVLEEKENTDRDGNILLRRSAFEAMFLWHAYGREPIGNRSDLENLSLEQIQKFWKSYYRPNNATLIVAGNFNQERVLASITALFGLISNIEQTTKEPVTVEPMQEGEREFTIRRRRTVPMMLAAYRTEDVSHPNYAAAPLLAYILGKEEKRLNDTLITTKLIDKQEVKIVNFADSGAIIFELKLEYGKGADLSMAQEKLLNILEKIAEKPITQEELDHAKSYWDDKLRKSKTDIELFSKEISYNAGRGDWRLWFLMRNHIQTITLEKLQSIAKNWFDANNRTVIKLIESDGYSRREPYSKVNLANQLKQLDAANGQVDR
ncbi:M16 family metallopeptidase [Undibacterium curvum]|uniref:Insulinase family protein n=1 Tax=Undibacterium curvum TaxID=2762294 RepID=A0ABR7A5C2_9BURK|nr:pitrilysin family protein [Undibacterium curvum]MBC3932047.1 insulinase family protein [Undibacterium curvum]